MKKLSLLVLTLCISAMAAAQVQSKIINYKEGSAKLEGFLFWDDAQSGPRPAVLIIHNWMGPSDETKSKAQALAEQGYAAFVADIYGTDLRPKDANAASAASSKFKDDRALYRKRIKAALDAMNRQNVVNNNAVVAIGYCFGGMGALEAARANFNVKGVVSFHGSLDGGTIKEATSIGPRVLVLHGADDPYVSAQNIAALESELRERHADWILIKYSGAVHSFTEKGAGDNNAKGAAYNATADRRSWGELQKFLGEVLR